jgi:tRNA(Leu) C34 or U34 (ribose-2'-O)-methylase TrmL
MHLNINQSLIVNTSSVIMSLQRVEINTLPNKIIQLNDHAQIKLPSTINLNISNSSSVIMRVNFFLCSI